MTVKALRTPTVLILHPYISLSDYHAVVTVTACDLWQSTATGRKNGQVYAAYILFI